MTTREWGLCNGIIHSASAAAAAVGGGLAQIPGSDNLVITPIQLAMAVSLGEVFGIRLDQSAAKAAVASATAATATTLGTIATGGTTTALNIGVIEAGRNIAEEGIRW